MIFQTRSKTKCFIYEQPICLIFYFLKSRMSKIVMGKIRIGECEIGKYRYLTEDEVKYLKRI